MHASRLMRYVKLFAVITIIAAFSALCSSGYAAWYSDSPVTLDMSCSAVVKFDDIKENVDLNDTSPLFIKLFAANPSETDRDGYVNHTTAKETLIFAKTDCVNSETKIEAFFTELFADSEALALLAQQFNAQTINTATVCNRLLGGTVARFKLLDDADTDKRFIITVSDKQYKLEIVADFAINRNNILYLKSEG